MSMSIFFYTIFIWPVRIIIEFIFLVLQEIFNNNQGLVIIALSVAVNSLLLPIYLVADGWQDKDRALQARMSKKLAAIKRSFRGDERQMVINAYYREMGYSVIQPLKSSVGLFLQIPFFIAAYQLLSHTPSLNGVSFFVIRNLGESDGLLRFGNVSVNLLPVFMTVVNLLSAFVYTKKLPAREKIQLTGIALVFLVLLYNSPSGLVIYWTTSNLFSLGKNLAIKNLKSPGKALYIVMCVAALAVIIIMLFGYTGINRYRYYVIFACLILPVVPFLWKLLIRICESNQNKTHEIKRLYFSSTLVFGILIGLLIPLQIIAASPLEFSSYGIFIFRTLLQSLTFSVVVALMLWAFTKVAIRTILCAGSVAASFMAVISYFVFSPSYGTMTRSFKFDDIDRLLHAVPIQFNLLILAGGILVFLSCIFFKRGIFRKCFGFAFQVMIMAEIVLSGLSLVSIRNEMHGNEISVETDTSGPEGFFRFTRGGANTVIFFIDRAVGVAMWTALDYMSELRQQLDGFVFYPHTITFANYTVAGLPPIFGGYDYGIPAINERSDQDLEQKIDEGFSILPKVFGEAGWRVFMTDPPIADSRTIAATKFFNNMKNVQSHDINGYFINRFKQKFPNENEKINDSFDFDILFRYGIFRTALPVLRYSLYYTGKWWRDGSSNQYERVLGTFSSLYYLPELCSVDEGENTLNIFMNETTHEDGAFSDKLYPSSGKINYSAEETARFGQDVAYTYAYIAVLKGIVKWVDFLKANDVYDNTRIIIVSDHGCVYKNEYFEEAGMEWFNPLLLVKERNSHGELQFKNDLMTNADACVIAAEDIDNPMDPYLKKPMDNSRKFDKDNPMFISGIPGSLKNHHKNTYKIRKSRLLLGDDIYKSSSWGKWFE
jgi:YidC/Oxa1 family membrane protein insertase